MNRIFLAVIFLVLATSLQSAVAQPLAEIQFMNMDHNFGKIKEEAGAASYNFTFTNSGNIPLILQHVEASCGCTTPEWSQEPILPGKQGFIKVSYNPEQRPGVFAKSITVTANVPKSVRVLTISGEVIPKPLGITDLFPVDFGKIRLSTDELSFVRIKDHEIKSDTIHLYNPGTTPLSIDFKIIPPHLTLKVIPTILPPKTKGVLLITFDAAKKGDYGFATNRVYMAYNGEAKFNDAIKISGTVEEDFSKLTPQELTDAPRIEYDSKIVDFKEIAEGTIVEHTFVINNKGKKELNIRSVTTSCGCTSGKPTTNKIAPGGSTELRVTFDSHERIGMQNKIITVISNDPEHSTTLLRIIGTVKK
jgi:Protein of unknown function (DUF1573)